MMPVWLRSWMLIPVFFIHVVFAGTENRIPYFTVDTWLWEIDENANVGSSPRFLHLSNDPVVLSAYDDEGQSLRFGLKDDNGRNYFTVDEHKGVVKLRKLLDREVIKAHIVRFYVTDGFDEDVRIANITINDINDNSPLFNQVRYNSTIREDAPFSSEVLRVKASDPDAEENGTVFYRIEQTDQMPLPFRINSQSGVILLNDNIDYEVSTKYRFFVLAQDGGIDRLSSSALVTVNVEDVQDAPPMFERDSYDTIVDENTPARTVVVTVRAHDGDRGKPNEIVYSLRSGKRSGLFVLDNISMGQIRLFRSLDRERTGTRGVYRLTVRATELVNGNRREGAFSETSFKITIRDLNDNRPRFGEGFYRISIPENTPVGSQLPVSIFVSDADQDRNSDVVMSVEWRYRNLVTVSPVTFRKRSNVSLILTSTLDFETRRSYQFKLFANESSNPRYHTPCKIHIEVTNENDNFPIFDQAHYAVNVSEGTPLNQTFFRVQAHDDDEGSFGMVYYSAKGNQVNIAVDNITGDISLLKELDFETTKRKQYILLAYNIAPFVVETTALLTIYVTDENDNAPVFPQRYDDVYVFENTALYEIAKIKAIDADSFPNNIVSYFIEPGRYIDHFSLITTNDGFGKLHLEVPFDFDTMNNKTFTLMVKASDQGGLYSTIPLVVHVKDQNDNPPVFDRIENITINENIQNGMVIGQITATDGDFGENSQIRFYVTDGQDLFGTIFQLNEKTGDISLKPGMSPDYEVTSLFNITITAQDQGTEPLAVTHFMQIKIVDVNDNSPKFEHSFYHVTTEENSEFVYQVQAEDLDSGDNGIVHYSIVSPNNDVFFINATNGLISNRNVVDFEELGNKIVLNVKAEDNGVNGKLHSLAKVIVTVTDINDNSPMFGENTPTHLVIMENTLAPFIATFTAHDADAGMNAKIKYSISDGNTLGLFIISSQDGEMRVTSGISLDREEKEFYNLTLSAIDSGTPPRQTVIDVQIRVLDVNDNSPVFEDLPSSPIRVLENSVNVSICQVHALDRDLGPNGRVTYLLESGNDAFYINPNTGIVDLLRSLDREEQSEHNLTVVAQDNPDRESNSKTTRSTIQIKVGDVNDEKPMFQSSTPYRAMIEEGSPVHTALTFVTNFPSAIDNDEGKNAKISYSVVGPASEYFAVDSQNGAIYTISDLDRESLFSDVIDLILRATDNGGLFSETIVKVTVMDVNDNAPQFVPRHTPIRVSEDIKPGVQIVQMNATDPDKGRNGKVVYGIDKGSPGKFNINPNTGVIYLAPGKCLDRESKSRYPLMVVASDQGISQIRSSTTEVIIILDDVNDSRPKFPINWQNISIHENSAVGTLIYTIVAEDADLNSVFVFNIVSVMIYGSDKRPLVVDQPFEKVKRSRFNHILSWFHLDPSTGKLFLSSSNDSVQTTLDREAASSIRLEFNVRDEASSDDEISMSLDAMMLQIEIIDQNDNSPSFDVISPDVIFSDDEVIVDVMEECVIGTKLISVIGRDKDQGSNGQVQFEIRDDVHSILALSNINSGVVIAANRIDRESIMRVGGNEWINFTLYCRDLGSPPRSSELAVRMRINDINDNIPRFLQRAYQASILEDAAVGGIVVQVFATDADSGDFGNVSYKLFGASGMFSVDAFSGVVTIAKPLDWESNPTHTFAVAAEDCLKERSEFKQSQVQVTVHVIDVNDNIPTFIQPHNTTLSIVENISLGTVITRVTAEDPDQGEYGSITYSCSSQEGYFTIDPYVGDVTIARPISITRRHAADTMLNITATDGGGLSNTISIEIGIIDVNDHSPVIISPTESVFWISEEEPGGHLVMQMSATDQDYNLNGIVRYRFLQSDSNLNDEFFVDDVTGRVVTSKRLDREVKSTYTLILEAFDLGTPKRSTRKDVTVHLIDINDNAPRFTQNTQFGAHQSLQVRENHIPGTEIGEVISATDRDENPKIFYHVISENGDETQRTFDVDGGEIVLRKTLDREKVDRYTLIIQASNSKKYHPYSIRSQHKLRRSRQNQIPKQSFLPPDPSKDPSLLRLTIQVLDVIDEPPKFSCHNYVIPVEDGTQPYTALGKVSASDEDLQDVISYSILQTTFVTSDNTSSPSHDFIIESSSGMLSSVATIEGAHSQYRLIVQAKDLSNLIARTNVTILIMKESQRFSFRIDRPPEVVKEQAENLTTFLRNLTNSHVVIDTINNHRTPANKFDVTRSDVTIRVFDSKLANEKIAEKLMSGGSKMNRLFKSYSFRDIVIDEKNDSKSEEAVLRVVVVILSLILILLLLIAVILFVHMRRQHKEALQKLRNLITIHDDDIMRSEAEPTEKHKFIAKNLNESSQVARCERQVPVGIQARLQDCTPVAASSLLWSPSVSRRQSPQGCSIDRRVSP